MKKLFILVALLITAILGFGETVTIFEVNYAELAYDNLEKGEKASLFGTGFTFSSTPNTATAKQTQSFYIKNKDNEVFLYPNNINVRKDQIDQVKNYYLSWDETNIGLTKIDEGYIGISIQDLKKDDIIEIVSTIAPKTTSDLFKGFNLTFDLEHGVPTATIINGNSYNATRYTGIVGQPDAPKQNYASFANYGYLHSIKIKRQVSNEGILVASGLNAAESLPVYEKNSEGYKTASFVKDNGKFFKIKTDNGNIYNANSSTLTQFINVRFGTVSENSYDLDYPPLLLTSGSYHIESYNDSQRTILVKGYIPSGEYEPIPGVINKGSESYDVSRFFQQDIDLTAGSDFEVEGTVLVVFKIEWEDGPEEVEKPKVYVGGLKDLEWRPEYAEKGFDLSSHINVTKANITDLNLTVEVVPRFIIDADNQDMSQFTQPKEWNENCGMYPWIWNQMTAIQNNNNRVDGYYFDRSSSDTSKIITNDGLIAYFPCSGKYELKITGPEDIEIVYENENQLINVYPSTNLIYEYKLNGVTIEEGLNINGRGRGESKGIEVVKGELDNLILYIPGVYLVDITYSYDGKAEEAEESASGEQNSVKRKVTYSNTIKNGDKIDLSNISDTGADLRISLSKNGAETPLGNDGNSEQAIRVTLVNTSTGVDGIEEEGREVCEYYTLQGIRVMNPEKGLFIKVEGGKAKKVWLK